MPRSFTTSPHEYSSPDEGEIDVSKKAGYSVSEAYAYMKMLIELNNRSSYSSPLSFADTRTSLGNPENLNLLIQTNQ